MNPAPSTHTYLNRFFNQKSSFTILILLFVLLFSGTVNAATVDSATVARIKTYLNLYDIPDQRLIPYLSSEDVAPGISNAVTINVVLNQIDFGYQLMTGSYYGRYQAYFNDVLDNNLNFRNFLEGQSRDALVAIATYYAGAYSGNVYGVIKDIGTVLDIDGVFVRVITAEIDQWLREYINARLSGDTDATAWADWQPMTLNLNAETLANVHSYYLSAWEAYQVAQDATAILQDLRNTLRSKLLPKPVIIVNPSTGTVPLTVNFDASGSTPVNGTTIQSYSWDFGDGNTDSGITTSHTFNSSDWFTVTLTVTDSEGVPSSATKNITVTSPVHASFINTKIDTLTIHFDASSSTDDKGNSHISSYSWDFGDGATTTTTNKQIDHVYSTDAFRYVKLTVSDDLGYSGSYTKIIKVGSPPGDLGTTIKGGTITGNDSWSADGSPYIVQGCISVAQGATLTIDQGVTVKSSAFCGHGKGVFTVGGSLKATGVTFTWADGQSQWYGIQFSGAGASGSKLENCVFEHATGVQMMYNGYWYNEGIIRISDSSPSITNSTIQNSDTSHGIVILGSDSSPLITGNTIRDMNNQTWNFMLSGNAAIYAGTNSAPTVTNNSILGNYNGLWIDQARGVYQGNTISNSNNIGIVARYASNNPVIYGNTYINNSVYDADINGTVTAKTNWDKGKINLGCTEITANASLNIAEGTTVKSSVFCGHGKGVFTVGGSLKATGVTFTWADGQSQWYGIQFSGAGASGSKLENCVFEHATGVQMMYNGYWYNEGIIRITDSSPSITNNTIQNSDSTHGIVILGSASSPVISGNTIRDMNNQTWNFMLSGNAAIYAGTDSAPTITNNSILGNYNGLWIDQAKGVYEGNTISNSNNIGIVARYASNNPVIYGNTYINNSVYDADINGTITANTNWDKGIISLGCTEITANASLNIAEGTTIKSSVFCGHGKGVFTVGGSLKATGVTFTWADGQSQWNGIQFNGAGASGSKLENCLIEHATGVQMMYNGYWYNEGIIRITDSSPSITNSTIQNSDSTHGIVILGSASSPVISGNTIRNTNSQTGNFMLSGNAAIYAGTDSAPTITNNSILGNYNGLWIDQAKGVYQGNTLSGNTAYGLYYSGSTNLTATNNNWGDPSGPLDDSDDRAAGGWYNPNGKGNKVSDHVNYYPWTGTTIAQTATPAGFAGTPRYTSINLSWHANSEPSLNGYKIYYGTTSGNYGTPIVVGKVTSYKLPGLTNDTPYYLAISSLNTVGAESALTTEITATPINKYALDLTIAGTGDGSVFITQGGTACNTNCSTLFDPNTTVNLKASNDEYSLFKGWTGAYIAANGDCDLTMDNDKAVTATFDTDKEHSVLIDLPEMKYYSSINSAYLDSSSIVVIKVWGTDFPESLLLNNNIPVTLKGGYDAGYSSNTGATYLHGTLTVGKGSLTVENLVLQ